MPPVPNRLSRNGGPTTSCAVPSALTGKPLFDGPLASLAASSVHSGISVVCSASWLSSPNAEIFFALHLPHPRNSHGPRFRRRPARLQSIAVFRATAAAGPTRGRAALSAALGLVYIRAPSARLAGPWLYLRRKSDLRARAPLAEGARVCYWRVRVETMFWTHPESR